MLEGILNIDKLPTLDLHGESIDISKIFINDFINDNVKMKNEYIAIIHGKGSGKLKEATKQVLSINKYASLSRKTLVIFDLLMAAFFLSFLGGL